MVDFHEIPSTSGGWSASSTQGAWPRGMAQSYALIQPWLKHLMACKMGINIPYYSGWWFGTWLLWLSIYWGCHHPNWRTLSFFRGVGIPPTSVVRFYYPYFVGYHGFTNLIWCLLGLPENGAFSFWKWPSENVKMEIRTIFRIGIRDNVGKAMS
jgi:hypothetical protein